MCHVWRGFMKMKTLKLLISESGLIIFTPRLDSTYSNPLLHPAEPVIPSSPEPEPGPGGGSGIPLHSPPQHRDRGGQLEGVSGHI